MIMVDRRSTNEAGRQAGTKLAVPVGAQITRPMTAQAASSYEHLPTSRFVSANVILFACDLSFLVRSRALGQLDFGTRTG